MLILKKKKVCSCLQDINIESLYGEHLDRSPNNLIELSNNFNSINSNIMVHKLPAQNRLGNPDCAANHRPTTFLRAQSPKEYSKLRYFNVRVNQKRKRLDK